VKPLSSEVEVDLSVDTQSENYDQEAPFRVTKQVRFLILQNHTTHYLNVLISYVMPLGRVEFVFTSWFNLISVDKIIFFFVFHVWIFNCVTLVLLFYEEHQLFVSWLRFYCFLCPMLFVVNVIDYELSAHCLYKMTYNCSVFIFLLHNLWLRF
jgi:hypothetical protein